MKIIKQELQFEESLKQRLEFICEFSKVTPTFINTFLVFNYSNNVYISILSSIIEFITSILIF